MFKITQDAVTGPFNQEISAIPQIFGSSKEVDDMSFCYYPLVCHFEGVKYFHGELVVLPDRCTLW